MRTAKINPTYILVGIFLESKSVGNITEVTSAIVGVTRLVVQRLAGGHVGVWPALLFSAG